VLAAFRRGWEEAEKLSEPDSPAVREAFHLALAATVEEFRHAVERIDAVAQVQRRQQRVREGAKEKRGRAVR
jgi:hypothetical protein